MQVWRKKLFLPKIKVSLLKLKRNKDVLIIK